ncbi:alpha/beta fold hydrolase [Arcticibacter sp. MXS-1]|uniref:alpha/beta fold hydrolase n=1 Tax=Arcticibacter sp. MXS-1 TaxID=3341726 RepID=UPI0035A9459F
MEDIIKRNNVLVKGEGPLTLMLAHGFGCDQNVWRYFIRAFEQQYRLVLFDYVGSGRSDLEAYNKQRYSTLSGYAQDVLDIIEALGLRDVIFIGHSVSSMIGMKAAIKCPHCFSKVIFVAPSPSYINDGDYVGGMEREDLESLFRMLENNYLGWSSTVAPLIMGNEDRPELGEELTGSFCAMDPDIARDFARVTFFSDCREDLKYLKVPSLTLQCAADMLAPPSVGSFMQQNMSLNTLVQMSATGHCPHVSAPEETIEAVRSYINTVTDGQSNG